MLITRDTILEALRTEPLVAGYFVAPPNDALECGVCAVGAVMRSVGASDALIRRTAHHMCQGGSVLEELSMAWEQMNTQKWFEERGAGESYYNQPSWSEPLRSEIIDWAERNVPAHYALHIEEDMEFKKEC